MTQSTISKVQSKKLISDLFRAIPDIWQGFYLMRDDLLEMNINAEKKHRKGCYSIKYNFPINDAAKYFVVQHLFDACKAVDGEGHLYTVVALLHVRLECLKAQAYVMENTEKFAEWKQLVENSKFSELDYCELIK